MSSYFGGSRVEGSCLPVPLVSYDYSLGVRCVRNDVVVAGLLARDNVFNFFSNLDHRITESVIEVRILVSIPLGLNLAILTGQDHEVPPTQ